jgi:hypothetical protein
MTIEQIERFYARFYPRWNRDAYYGLMEMLKVAPRQRISRMSCGQRSQVSLDQQGDPGAGFGPHRADILAEDQTLSGARLEIAAQNVDGRGFSGAVFTQKSEDPPARNLETQVFVYQSLPVTMGEVAAFDDRIGHKEWSFFRLT